MAKALLGHIGLGVDQRMLSELRQLRGRVLELETEVERLHALTAELMVSGATVDRDLLALSSQQPALT